LLSPILDEDVNKGARGKILVDDRVLAALRRMVERECEALSPRVAQSEIIRELGNGDGKRKTTFAEDDGLLIAEKDARIDELKERVKERQKEAAFLRARVEELTPLARLRWSWTRRPTNV